MLKTYISYLHERLKPLGIEPEGPENSFTYHVEYAGHQTSAEPKTVHLFQSSKDGHIEIRYPSLVTGAVQMYLAKNGSRVSNKEIVRLRYNDADVKRSGGELPKYVQPKGSPAPVFIPVQLYELAWARTHVPTLYITEGEFKAAKGALHGLPIAGITGIHNLKEGREETRLHEELVALIERVKPRNLVFLYDSDFAECRYKEGEFSSNRAYSFYNSLVHFKRLVTPYDVDLHFGYIRSEYGQKLGLDDLFLKLEAEGVKPRKIIADLKKAVKHQEQSQWFFASSISATSPHKLRKYFYLDDPQQFYEFHKERIGETGRFRMGKLVYRVENGQAREEKDPDRIEQDYFTLSGNQVFRTKDAFKVSNFVMENKFLIKSNQNPRRIIEITNTYNHRCLLDIGTDKTFNVTEFQALVFGKGRYLWHGNKADLGYLWEMISAKAKEAQDIPVLGWHPTGKFWAWANGIYADGAFLEADDYGIVEHQERFWFLPAFSRLTDADDTTYQGDRKFRHKGAREDFSIGMLGEYLYRAYQDRGALALAWCVAVCYYDVCFELNGYFPLLFAYGIPGSGKNTMANILLSLWGDPAERVGLESNTSTPKGIARKLSQYGNAPCFLDEYKNSIHPQLIGVLKGAYDGTGTTRAETSNDNRTKGSPVRRGLIVAGQEMPTVDNALLMRTILLKFMKSKFTEEERIALSFLKEEAEKGFTHLTCQLLNYRSVVAQHFPDVFTQIKATLVERLAGTQVDDRLIGNYASILTPVLILLEKFHLELGMDRSRLLALAVENIKAQNSAKLANEETEHFWTALQYLVDLHKIGKGTHFKIENGKLYLWMQRIEPAYLEYVQRVGRAGYLTGQSLREYLKHHQAFVEIKDARFRIAPDSKTTKSTSAFVFEYSRLNLSLDDPEQESTLPLPSDEDTPF